jgi:hypothetical protein
MTLLARVFGAGFCRTTVRQHRAEAQMKELAAVALTREHAMDLDQIVFNPRGAIRQLTSRRWIGSITVSGFIFLLYLTEY